MNELPVNQKDVLVGCGNCVYWTKANNEFRGIPIGQCSKGFYCIFSPLDRSEPFYLERPVTLDDGNIACGEYKTKQTTPRKIKV